MSTTTTAFPNSIRKIIVLGRDGATRSVFEAGKRPAKGHLTRLYRPVEGELHAHAKAAAAYHAKYLELHERSNAEEESNGSLAKLGENIRDSQKAAWDAWTENSPAIKRQKKFYRKIGLL